MKRLLFLCFLFILGLVISRPAQAEEPKSGDFLSSLSAWKIAFPKTLTPRVEIVPDAFEGKPALQIAVPEGEIEAWKGKVSHTAALPTPGDYTLTFFAKVEPDVAAMEVSVWGSVAGQAKNVGARQNFQTGHEWQEFVYELSAEGADPAANITWSNLARGGRTFSIADIRLKKAPQLALGRKWNSEAWRLRTPWSQAGGT